MDNLSIILTTGTAPESFILLSIAAAAIAALASSTFYLFKQLKHKNGVIAAQSAQLQQVTEKLNNQALAKEKHLVQFFTMISDNIGRVEKMKRTVERKMMVKRYEDVLLALNDFNIKKEREQLFTAFDSAFLAMFPHFVQEFNAMLKADDQIWPAKPDILTKELRIFALMRLGINDCETMSGILEYSTNTVYVYKMRVRSKSVFGGEQFEQKLMDIKAGDVGKPVLRRSA